MVAGPAGTHSTSRFTIRRLRWTVFGTCRFTTRVFCLTYLTGRAFADLMLAAFAIGFSATWTAPPASNAVPAAVADSFARAILTDMGCTLVSSRGFPPARPVE